MFCTNCGKEIPDGASFCTSCGSPVKITPKTETTPNQQFGGMTATTLGSSAAGLEVTQIDIILAIVGAILWILGSLLPYIAVNVLGFEEATSLIKTGEGWLFIILSIAIIAVLYFRKDIVYYILVAVGFLFHIYVEVSISKALGGEELFAGFVHKKPGYYFLIIGTVLMVISVIMHFLRKKNETKTV